MKIGILGIGGIGGFIASKMLQSKDKDEIILITKERQKRAIISEGLTLLDGDKSEKVHVIDVVSTNDKIEKLDILFIAIKSYDLKESLKNIRSSISDKTLIIPLLNGISIKNIICDTLNLSERQVIDGCIYIISNKINDSTIRHVGGPGRIIIGGENQTALNTLQTVLEKYDLDIGYHKDIKEILWKKFLFVSPISAISTANGVTFGALQDDAYLMIQCQSLMEEVILIAKKLGINLSHEDIKNTIEMLKKFPYEAKSSFQLDIEKNQKNEKNILIDDVISLGEKLDLDVINYISINQQIMDRYLCVQ
ncbi:ketopantoate reductase family protein [Flammeovirga agarivorans]|uniref:2-dehydropantoate 2-reductase n=1 Tax=Flammeovirga agarivorans TaxID=2726742 RepID=A0A7X8SPM1_9BACT|nr:2-dehydropantoate 2-reductase [Flammeovirga agarivorans]NLR94013.1 2-dehydropantoate 2-reductase [Flammeovirga agarivorans]